jgi:hypothetical protein
MRAWVAAGVIAMAVVVAVHARADADAVLELAEGAQRAQAAVSVTAGTTLRDVQAAFGPPHAMKVRLEGAVLEFVRHDGKPFEVTADGGALASRVLSLRARLGWRRRDYRPWHVGLAAMLDRVTTVLSSRDGLAVDRAGGLGFEVARTGERWVGRSTRWHVEAELASRRVVVRLLPHATLRVESMLLRHGLPSALEAHGGVVRIAFEGPRWGPMIAEVRPPVSHRSRIERLELLGREPLEAMRNGVAMLNALDGVLETSETREQITRAFGVASGEDTAHRWRVTWTREQLDVEALDAVDLKLSDLQARYGHPLSTSWHMESAYVVFAAARGMELSVSAHGATLGSTVKRISVRRRGPPDERPAAGERVRALLREGGRDITPRELQVGDLERELGLAARVDAERRGATLTFEHARHTVEAKLPVLGGSSTRIERLTISPSSPP